MNCKPIESQFENELQHVSQICKLVTICKLNCKPVVKQFRRNVN